MRRERRERAEREEGKVGGRAAWEEKGQLLAPRVEKTGDERRARGRRGEGE